MPPGRCVRRLHRFPRGYTGPLPPSIPLHALLSYQLRTSGRVAVRLLVPLVVVYMVLFSLDGGFLVRSLGRALFPAEPNVAASAAVLAMCFAAASQSARLLAVDRGGWLRHLPFTTQQHRIARGASLTLVQTPLVGFLLIMTLVDRREQLALSLPLYGGGLALASAAAGCATEGSRRSRGLFLISGLLGALCRPGALAAGAAVAMLAAWLRLREPPRMGPAARRRAASRPSAPRTPLPLELRINWRATRRAARIAWLPSLLPVLGGLAFVLNNEMPRVYALLGLRLGMGLGIAFCVLTVASALAENRPPWPWSRSLPVASARRVALDAAFLALTAAPLLLTSLLAPRLAPALLATGLPLLLAVSIRGAGAVASAGADRSRGLGVFAGEGASLSALTALAPPSAAALVVALPWLWRRAAARDRRAPVTRFQELQQRASGDPMTWSSQ